MTEWTLHQPAFDGDAPEGVGLETHEIECGSGDGNWFEIEVGTNGPRWGTVTKYRYRPRAASEAPATYAQVKAWLEQHGHPVPPKPVDYEAWRPVLEAGGWSVDTPLDDHDKSEVDDLIKAYRVAMAIPACMEDVKG